MEERQTLMMTVLAAVLVALVLIIRFVEPPEAEPEDAARAQDLIALSPEQVVHLSLVTAEGTLEAERGESGWTLLAPRRVPARDEALDELVGVADRLQVGEPLSTTSKADFGLDQPRALLLLRTADGQEHRVRVGAETPVGYKTYVEVDDSGVRIASGRPGDALLKPFDSFREDRVLSLATSALEGISWSKADGGWSVERRPSGWWLEDGRRADTGALTALGSAVAELRFESFWDELSDAEAGLDTPWATLTLRAGGELTTLRFGAERAGGRLVRAPDGTLGTVSVTEDLDIPRGELLESRLLPMPPSAVDSVSLELDGRRRAWARQDESWTRDGSPDPDEGVNAVRVVMDCAADRAARPAELQAPSGRVEVGAGEERVVVVLGEATEGGRAARDEAGGPPFLVPQSCLDLLNSALD